MTPLERREPVAKALREAAAVVERGWTQRAWARTAHGWVVGYHMPDAARWCAEGAIRAVHGGWYAWDALRTHLGMGISVWNDVSGRTAAEVAVTMRECAVRVERGEL